MEIETVATNPLLDLACHERLCYKEERRVNYGLLIVVITIDIDKYHQNGTTIYHHHEDLIYTSDEGGCHDDGGDVCLYVVYLL